MKNNFDVLLIPGIFTPFLTYADIVKNTVISQLILKFKNQKTRELNINTCIHAPSSIEILTGGQIPQINIKLQENTPAFLKSTCDSMRAERELGFNGPDHGHGHLQAQEAVRIGLQETCISAMQRLSKGALIGDN